MFRAGGTSLNGQSQTDSILVDVRRHWQRATVLDDGARSASSPGSCSVTSTGCWPATGASSAPTRPARDIACVGGVIANNSGGMRCGVVADSYRTVRSLKLVLANGAVIDTAEASAEEQFAAAAPELARGLVEIRDELRADRELAERVARKFEIKNTTGYRLCAFLDADTPLEIFRRLVIGSEGTLAFIAEAVFETVPFGSHATIALVFFDDIDAAANAVGALVSCRRERDRADGRPDADRRRRNMPGTPERWKKLPPDGGRAARRVPRRRGRRARRARARGRSSSSRPASSSTRRGSRAIAMRSRCCGTCARGCRDCWRRSALQASR